MCPSRHNLRSHPASSSSNSTAATNSSLRSAFHVIDVDRDGKISRDDLQSFCATCCKDDVVIESMMEAADTNEDGFVEYEEFERVLVMPSTGGVMEEAFRVMDKNGDGKLSREDLKNFMACAGIAVTEEDVQDMIELADGNDVVSFDGFVRILGL